MTPQLPEHRDGRARHGRARRVGCAAGSVSAAVAWLVCAVATVVHLTNKAPWPGAGLNVDLDTGLSRTFAEQIVNVALAGARFVARALG